MMKCGAITSSTARFEVTCSVLYSGDTKTAQREHVATVGGVGDGADRSVVEEPWGEGWDR